MLTLYTGNVKRQHKCFNLRKKSLGVIYKDDKDIITIEIKNF